MNLTAPVTATHGLDEYHRTLATLFVYSDGTRALRIRRCSEYAESGGLVSPEIDLFLDSKELEALRELLK